MLRNFVYRNIIWMLFEAPDINVALKSIIFNNQ